MCYPLAVFSFYFANHLYPLHVVWHDSAVGDAVVAHPLILGNEAHADFAKLLGAYFLGRIRALAEAFAREIERAQAVQLHGAARLQHATQHLAQRGKHGHCVSLGHRAHLRQSLGHIVGVIFANRERAGIPFPLIFCLLKNIAVLLD